MFKLVSRVLGSAPGKMLYAGLKYLKMPGDELPLVDRWFYRGQYRKGRKAIWDDLPALEGLLKEYVEGPKAISPGSALDIGCGTGRNTFYLARRGWRVTATDIYEEAIARGEKTRAALGLLDRCRFVMGSALSLDRLPGAPFDLALDSYGPASDIAPTLRAAYAQQVAKVLRPGGVFLIYSFVEEKVCRPFLGSFSIEARLTDKGFRGSGIVPGHWYALRRLP